jgi:hypothetical protein
MSWRGSLLRAGIDISEGKVSLVQGLGINAQDAQILHSARIATGTAGGTSIAIDATDFQWSEAFELRYHISDWADTYTLTEFKGIYLRVENREANAAASIYGAQIYGVANAVNTGSVWGALVYGYAKGALGITIGNLYGIQSEISWDAGSAAQTITTEATPFLGKVTGGQLSDYTKVHGMILRFGDMDGGSRTYGNGIKIEDDGDMSGTCVLTTGINIAIGCTTGISLSGTMTTGINIGACATGLRLANDSLLSLGTTVTTAETKITAEFDETTTGIGLINLGSVSVPMVLNTNPGSAVIAETVNINHSAGAGDCDDLIAAYHKVNVIGSGDAGTTIVGHASRAYVGLTGGADNSVASAAYGSQPWARHQGTGAITAMSGVSAKLDVGADAFTASTVNAGHFHIDGDAIVTGQFDGVMIEIYPAVTSMDNGLKIAVDAGAAVVNAIGIAGTVTTAIDMASAVSTNLMALPAAGTGPVVANALVPAAVPDGTTVGAAAALKVLINNVAYYIALYDSLHA